MSKIKTRKTQNALISKHFSLTADEAEVISQLTVRTGKVTAGRKRTTSGVWKYFGSLCRRQEHPVTVSASTECVLNNMLSLDFLSK
jgi:hypothetical protein